MKPTVRKLLILLSIVVATSLILMLSFGDPGPLERVGPISTVILAFLTACYVMLTYQILKATRPQPTVFVSLPTNDEDSTVLLSIKNIGARPAYNVNVTIEPSLDILAPTEAFKGTAGPMLNQPFMPPESEVLNVVSCTPKILGLSEDEKRFKVQIRFKDSQGCGYSDSYQIDLSTYIFERKFNSVRKLDS
jgi:hypothetical protein